MAWRTSRHSSTTCCLAVPAQMRATVPGSLALDPVLSVSMCAVGWCSTRVSCASTASATSRLTRVAAALPWRAAMWQSEARILSGVLPSPQTISGQARRVRAPPAAAGPSTPSAGDGDDPVMPCSCTAPSLAEMSPVATFCSTSSSASSLAEGCWLLAARRPAGAGAWSLMFGARAVSLYSHAQENHRICIITTLQHCTLLGGQVSAPPATGR